MKRVTVFGGAAPQPGDSVYEEALRLGRLLGQAGYTVLNGGYIGTMEAVSRGASEAGGHVIGITCRDIESWRPVKANAWVHEERPCGTLRDRIYALMEGCDAALALPGGPGTLAEIAMMWNHLLVKVLAPRPLILIGSGWQAVFDQLYQSQADWIPLEQRRWVSFAADVDRAFAQLQERIG